MACPPPTYGGLERIVFDLGVSLSKMGHEVAIACTTDSRIPPPIKHIPTVKSKISTQHDWFSEEENAYNIWKEHAKDYDIIAGHNWFAHEYLYKMDNPNAKVIHTHHGHINWQTPPPVKYPNLCGISQFMAKEYSKQLGINARAVYNGIDLDLYPYSEEHGERLLYVGRFATYKQPHVAIDIARRLRMPIDICGGSMFVEDQGYVTRLFDQADGKMVRIFPDVPHAIKLKLLQNAKCLLFPSAMKEPFGLVCLEANLCGTPTIGLRDGAIPEILKDGVNGFVCDNDSEMVEAVKKIDSINRKECRRWAENFSKEKMGFEYEKLYKAILDNQEW